MTDTRYTAIREVGDVTQEVLDAAVEVMEGWYAEGRISWSDFWDRLDGAPLDDDTRLDLGEDTQSPALLHIKAHVLKVRRAG